VTALPSLGEIAVRRIAADRRPRLDDGLPPGPTSAPVLQLAGFLYRPLPFFTACRDRYGECFSLRLPGMPPIVQFSHPEAVKQVFAGSMDTMHAGKANEVLAPFLGRHSVLVLDGARHKSQRRLLMPPFRGERMRAYGQAMHDITAARIAGWRSNRNFRIQTETLAITLDFILLTVLGL
jgi:cytochrome P450